jgi:glycosyltransferase involved in cell wall biosynthesis
MPELNPKPFWSVMIPTYNPHLGYLEETLRSVLDQAPGAEQMQIEVVDDGSPNGVPIEFIRKITGERVTVYAEPRNLGLAGIWNRCIERARGEWIHILHQDDLVYPGFYESLGNGVQKNPDAGAALCRHAYADENGHWQELSILELPAPGMLRHFVQPLVTGYHVQCAAIVVKKSTYEIMGAFNPDLKHALDWEMWIRIASKFPIFYEPKILACWRNHSRATTSKQIRSGENLRDIAKAIGLWSRQLPVDDGQRLAEIARHRFAREGLSTARHLLGRNDFAACLNQVNAALACKKSFRWRWQALKIQVKARAKKALNYRRTPKNDSSKTEN